MDAGGPVVRCCPPHPVIDAHRRGNITTGQSESTKALWRIQLRHGIGPAFTWGGHGGRIKGGKHSISNGILPLLIPRPQGFSFDFRGDEIKMQSLKAHSGAQGPLSGVIS
jgi:hypothetical protein